MEQMNVEESLKVEVDFQKGALPKSAKELTPLVFKEGDRFCCLLGPDLERGVSGYGETPELAVVEWDANLTSRLAEAKEDDQVIAYVKDMYKSLNSEVW